MGWTWTWTKTPKGVESINLGKRGGEGTQNFNMGYTITTDPRETQLSRTWGTEQETEKIRGFHLAIAPKTSLPTGP